MNWLDPLRARLDLAAGPIRFFFRDDDGGWGDARLEALLGVFARHRVPIDLALIPAAVEPALARNLQRRVLSAPGLLGLHQHGFRHVDHQVAGRRCEFGAGRSFEEQRSDIAAGAAMLHGWFAEAIDPVFTPPWNRCSEATAIALRQLGWRALSRNRGATPLPLNGLAAVDIAVDWQRFHAGGAIEAAGLAKAIADACVADGQTGIMLHHAVMDAGDLMALDGLLTFLAGEPRIRCCLMREFLAERPLGGGGREPEHALATGGRE